MEIVNPEVQRHKVIMDMVLLDYVMIVVFMEQVMEILENSISC